MISSPPFQLHRWRNNNVDNTISQKTSTIRSDSRFKTIAASNQDAAKLLMQVRKIAIDEMVYERTITTKPIIESITPVVTPRPRMLAPRNRIDTPSPQEITIKKSVEVSPPIRKSRTISICSQDSEEKDETITIVPPSPNVSPKAVRTCTKKLKEKQTMVLPVIKDLSLEKIPTPGSPNNKKYVGHVLPEGVKLKDVLRKKFSWKSYPELEGYLIEHRRQYLEYSNSLNYTKAQKLYNNRLTQGLLDLASETGYLFEDFTFAAVRDRIRCFYKSFVQATKKKKRTQKRFRAGSI